MDTKDNKVIGVTVYNVSPLVVKLGDVLTINAPELIVLDIVSRKKMFSRFNLTRYYFKIRTA